MGVAIPQVVSEDRASGAQIVNGCLRFDSSRNQHLQFTPGSSGNRKTWTFSCWIKRNGLGDGSTSTTAEVIFSSGASTANWGIIQLNTDNTLQSSVYAGSSAGLYTNALFRDTGSFFHLCSVFDTTASGNNKWRTYINGVQQTYSNSNYPSDNTDYQFSQSGKLHRIGYGEWYADFQLSQVYFIDGQALGPEYFGYTDPLTNVWRPKKFKPQATPNNGTTWSSGWDGNAVNPTYAFDGTNNVTSPPNGTTTWTAPSTINVRSSLRLYIQPGISNYNTLIVNGTSYNQAAINAVLGTNEGWFTISSATSLTSITLTGNGGNNDVKLRHVEVDGVTLLNGDTTNIGLNAFYLPFDGSAPIGQDQSGRGNNWTPVNFGGSNTIEKATGALPILNTDGGGKVATPGVLGSKIGKTYTVTVPGGTGGGFYLDGVQEPTLSFIRGATYTFDQSAASNSGHPLLFSTTQDGTTYTDGVTTSGTPGSSGAFTKITVPHNSADTLYYKCGNHSGMGASISVTTDEKKSDLYAWKNVLALPLVGVATDVVQQINGNSAAMSSFTANNATFAVHPTDGAPYGTGLYLNSVSDYPNINYAAGTFNFLHNQTGSGTVEFWMYNGSFNTEAVMLTSISGSPDVGFAVQMASSTTLQAVISRGVSGSARNSGTANIPQNTWSHIAVTKTINGSNAELKLYVNGVLSASNTSITASDLSNSNSTYSYFRIGQNIGDETARGWTNYYMNDLRIYDTVKYTQNFIPASTDPDVVPDSPSGVSYSSNVALVPSTDGAVAFDGSGDYLQLSYNADFDLANSDFTIEAFANTTDTSTNYPSIIGRWQGAGAACWDFRPQSTDANDNFFFIYNDGSSNITVDSGAFVCDGAWHHLAVTRSGSNLYMFVDGILRKTHNIGSATIFNNASVPLYIGYDPYGSSYYNGFASNVHLVKGTALYTSNFTPPSAPISSVENTKLLCCKSNSSATAADVTPGTITANGNAAASNFNPFTVNINTQRGKQSGYATWNPLNKKSTMTLSNGNLTASCAIDGSAHMVGGTIGVSSGKWYWEYDAVRGTGGGWEPVVYTDPLSPITTTAPSNTAYAWTVNGNNGNLRNNNTDVVVDYFNNISNGDRISCALDMDNGKVWFAKNGIWGNGGNPASNDSTGGTGLTGTWYPSVLIGSDSGAASATANFGQKPFKFPPPAGFQPLTLANTPRPTIVRPDQFVGVTTYTGDGSSERRISVGFKPDFVWIKGRTAADPNDIYHMLFDSVRGVQNRLNSNTTNSEFTESTTLSSFNPDGFTTGGNVQTNGTSKTYVAWAWKAGGNSNTFNIDDVGYATASAAGLTAGTKTPTGASVNTKSGFSIIAFTGDQNAGTISHGLGRAPSFYIVKTRDSNSGGSNDWYCYHSALGASARIQLNSTAAQTTGSSQWNSTSPTSSVLSLGSGTWQETGDRFIIYAWAEIPGFSKFGSYTGTSSTNFVNLGFKPAWVMIKNSSSSSYPTYTGWAIFDTERTPNNTNINAIFANKSQQEGLRGNGSGSINPADFSIDLLSNGFCLRDNGASEINLSGNSYIFAAFAEAPTFNLYGAQANAR
jgi:hypothetical protein